MSKTFVCAANLYKTKLPNRHKHALVKSFIIVYWFYQLTQKDLHFFLKEMQGINKKEVFTKD